MAVHERLSDRGQTRYDWQHYIPLMQRKPGVLRNGAPFADMAELQPLAGRPGARAHPAVHAGYYVEWHMREV